MPELQTLLLVLLVIYGAECLVWVPLGGIAFAAYREARFRILQPGALAGNQRGGIVVAQPIPPLGLLFVVRAFPISASPEGIFSFVASSVHRDRRLVQPASWFRLHDVKDVRVDGKKVWIANRLLLKAATPLEAVRIVRFVKALAHEPAEKRRGLIDTFIAAGFDTPALQERVREFRKHGLLLRKLSNVLLAFLFLIAPAVIWRFGFQASAWPLVAVLLAQTVTIAFLFRHAHKALYPDGADERFVPFTLMLLAPASAARAHDFLARHALSEFHPLAVAKALCAPETFKTFARRLVSDMRYPMYPVIVDETPEAVAAEQLFRTATLKAAEDFLQASGIDPNEVTMRPVSPEPETRSYCPRCGMEFVAAEAACGDCGGRPSLALATGSGKRRE